MSMLWRRTETYRWATGIILGNQFWDLTSTPITKFQNLFSLSNMDIIGSFMYQIVHKAPWDLFTNTIKSKQSKHSEFQTWWVLLSSSSAVDKDCPHCSPTGYSFVFLCSLDTESNYLELLSGEASAQMDSGANFGSPKLGFAKRTITWSNFGFSKIRQVFWTKVWEPDFLRRGPSESVLSTLGDSVISRLHLVSVNLPHGDLIFSFAKIFEASIRWLL